MPGETALLLVERWLRHLRGDRPTCVSWHRTSQRGLSCLHHLALESLSLDCPACVNWHIAPERVLPCLRQLAQEG